MTDQANEILQMLQNGSLPDLNANSTNTGTGIDTSQRELGESNFGLQTLNEGVEIGKESK